MPKGNFCTYAISLSIVVLIIAFFILGQKSDREEAKKCLGEKSLQFEGIIGNYQTDIASETSKFNLGTDTTVYKIPRSSKEMLLGDGDTIKKIAGENSYVVRHNSSLWKHHIDTFRFECSKR